MKNRDFFRRPLQRDRLHHTYGHNRLGPPTSPRHGVAVAILLPLSILAIIGAAALA